MDKKIFNGFLVVYIIYGLFYIFNSSIVMNGTRYFVLIDDAMISMQFAKNFAMGNGLVWSIGERVEGFTNFLWTMYMAIPHLLNIPLHLTSLFIQLTAMVFMIGTLVLVRKTVLRLTGDKITALAAVVLTGFFIPLNFWFYQGMEVSVLAFIVTAVVYMILMKKNDNLIFAACGLATLVRIDMAVFFVLVLIMRRENLKKGLIFFLSFFAVQTAARYMYFGEFLPNTYYLKVAGFPLGLRIFKGFVMLFKNLYYMNWIAFLIPMFLIKKGKVFWFLLAVPFSQMAYSVYVGGDAWEAMGGTNRYVTIAMPVFFVLFSIALRELTGLIIKNKKYVLAAYFVMTGIFLVNFNCLHGTRSLVNLKGPVEELPFTRSRLDAALYLKENTAKNDTIAVFAGGIIPYFSDKRYFIDFLGKNDKYIARVDMMEINSFFELVIALPGHMKFDYDYTVNILKPDYMVITNPKEFNKFDYFRTDYKKTAHPNVFKRVKNGN